MWIEPRTGPGEARRGVSGHGTGHGGTNALSVLTPLRLAMIRSGTQTVTHMRPQAEPLPRVLAEFSTEIAAGEPMQARWTRVRITQVSRDEYLCEKTRGPVPLETRTATVGNLESAKAFFGGGWVVKELFAALDPARFPRWP